MRAILKQEFLDDIRVKDVLPFNPWCSVGDLESIDFPSLSRVTLGVAADHEGRILDNVAKRDERRIGGKVIDLTYGDPAVVLTYGNFNEYRDGPVPEVADQIRNMYLNATGHFYSAEQLWVPVQGIQRVTDGFYLDPVRAISEADKPVVPVA